LHELIKLVNKKYIYVLCFGETASTIGYICKHKTRIWSWYWF